MKLNELMKQVFDLGDVASLESIDQVVLSSNDSQSSEFAGTAYLLNLSLEKALQYYSKSGNQDRIDELRQVALWYGGDINVVKALASPDEYFDFLLDRSFSMIPLYHDEDGFYIQTVDFERIKNEISQIGLDPTEVLKENVKELVSTGGGNTPIKYFLAKKTKNPDLIHLAKIDYNIRKSSNREQNLSLVEDYACKNGARVLGVIQEGDEDRFFPNSAFLCAIHTPDGDRVLKERLRFQLDYADPKGQTREKEILEQIEHPNIVGYYGSFFHEGTEFLIFEFAQGHELTEHIDPANLLSQELAISYARDLADVLKYLHEQDIIYMDVKPKNIIVHCEDLTLLDFGMVQHGEKAHSLLSTPRYLTPEMVLSFTSYKASDIFQLGIVLYETLTGEHPFEFFDFKEGEDCRQSEVLKYGLAHAYSPVRDSEVLNVNPELKELVYEMLDKDPLKRPCAVDVRQRLEVLI